MLNTYKICPICFMYGKPNGGEYCIIHKIILPIVNHQFLHSQQSFITNIGIFVAQQLHNNLFTTQLFQNAKKQIK